MCEIKTLILPNVKCLPLHYQVPVNNNGDIWVSDITESILLCRVLKKNEEIRLPYCFVNQLIFFQYFF